jgi:hydrogenase maturation protein HypF
MIERGINSVETSACGRLFDAVASIAGVRDEVNFEAQAAIALEVSAAAGVDSAYPFDILDSEPWQIDMRPAIQAIVRDVLARRQAGFVSAAFHNTVAAIVVEVCRRLRAREGIGRVCLSGGTFQNMYLRERTVAGLRTECVELNASRCTCTPRFRPTMAGLRWVKR